MKPLAENRHVERILSLIVILYGLRLLIPVGEEIPLYIGWLPVLPRATVGCLLIVFFPRVVQIIGYFATAGTPRSERRWFAGEIVAIPIILHAFTEIFFVFYYSVSLISWIVCYLNYYESVWLLLNQSGAIRGIPENTVYFVVAMLLLFYTRRIAAWLLRLVER